MFYSNSTLESCFIEENQVVILTETTLTMFFLFITNVKMLALKQFVYKVLYK